MSFVGHIKRLNVFAGSFETAFQPLAALGFPERVLKTVDEQNRRVAALDGNRGAGNKVFSLPKPCSSLPVRHLLAAFLLHFHEKPCTMRSLPDKELTAASRGTIESCESVAMIMANSAPREIP